jgi:anaerobic selenocysteine-containing dehydrogenase
VEAKTISDEIHYRVCPLCEATCGLEVAVRDAKVRRIRGDKDDPFSAGFICPKGSTLGHLQEDPDWLRQPLIRRDGKHVPVSFDEAFEHIAKRLGELEFGSAERGVYLGNPSVHNPAGGLYIKPLLRALGTFNIFTASTVDQMPRHISSALMYGDPGLFALPDLDRTDYLLILGADPLVSNGSLATAPDWPGRLRGIQERGGKITVVDPRYSKTAKVADEYVSVLPGTDALLLAAIVNSVVESGSVTLGPAERYISGVDVALEAIAPFTPERVAPVTGVPAETIRRVASEFCSADTAAAYGRMGVHTTQFGTLASWLTDLLAIVTGNLDVPGGLMFGQSSHGRSAVRPGGKGFSLGRWESEITGTPERNGEFPVATMAESMTSSNGTRIRFLVTIAGNPVLSTPDSAALDEAMRQLDFMVSIDPYLNDTTRHAEVILPPPPPLERSHYDFALGGISLRRVPRWSPPVFAATTPPEHDLMARLTQILRGSAQDPDAFHEEMLTAVLERAVSDPRSRVAGEDPEMLGALVTGDPGPDRILDVLLRAGDDGDGFGSNPDGLSLAVLQENPHGVDLGELVERLPNALKTRSGQVEAAPEPIIDDVPRLVEFMDTSAGGSMRLIGRRHLRSNNSWMHNLRVLVKGKERCTAQLHPEDARRMDIDQGMTIRVSSAVGTISLPAEITSDIRVGVVSIPHGWGHASEGTQLSVASLNAGVNTNLLTDGTVRDPLSGNTQLNGIPVEISPV